MSKRCLEGVGKVSGIKVRCLGSTLCGRGLKGVFEGLGGIFEGSVRIHATIIVLIIIETTKLLTLSKKGRRVSTIAKLFIKEKNGYTLPTYPKSLDILELKFALEFLILTGI